MGSCLVAEAIKRKHRVTVVSGPSEFALPSKARVFQVEQAIDMQKAMKRHAGKADAVIMAAAVCDFRPNIKSRKKIARRGRVSLQLTATPDILRSIPRRENQVFAGFALETGDVFGRALRKLKSKKLDLVVAQDANFLSGPFGKNKIKACVLKCEESASDLRVVSKKRLARAILDEIEQLCYVDRKA
jgi:phosphopantothenoylcysteine decarboxylase/phosphopantothenate--cysteine ligase